MASKREIEELEKKLAEVAWSADTEIWNAIAHWILKHYVPRRKKCQTKKSRP